MICPHCGNEVVVQYPAINLLPNINGCNPVLTTFVQPNPAPGFLTVCAPANVNAAAGCNPSIIITTIKI